MRLGKWILICLIGLSVVSCNSGTSTNKTKIAKYKDHSLFLEDLQSQLRPYIGKEDSAQQVRALINSWLRQQVLLDNAQYVIADSSAQIEELIEDYKNSLLIYHYENELSQNEMDTVVSDSVLLEYYNANKKNFELKRNIVKIWYAKFANPFDKEKSFLPYFKNNSTESEMYVTEFCEQYAVNYFVTSKNWLYFDEIRKEIPLDPSYDQSAFIRNNKFRQFEDQEYVYLLKIIDYKVKQSLSPFELVKNEIKQMILNKRRVDLLNMNQRKLVKKALEKGDAKIL